MPRTIDQTATPSEQRETKTTSLKLNTLSTCMYMYAHLHVHGHETWMNRLECSRPSNDPSERKYRSLFLTTRCGNAKLTVTQFKLQDIH